MAIVISLSKIAELLKKKSSRKKLLEYTLAMCSVCQEDMNEEWQIEFQEFGKGEWEDEENKIEWYGTKHKSKQQGGKINDPGNYRLICNVCKPIIQESIRNKDAVRANAYYRQLILAAIDRMQASGYENIVDGDDKVNRFVKDAIEEYIERRNKKIVPVVKTAYNIDVSRGDWEKVLKREMFNHLNKGVGVIEEIKAELIKMTSVVESSQKKIKELEGELPPDPEEMAEGALLSYIESLRKEEYEGSDFIVRWTVDEERRWLGKLEADGSEEEQEVAEVDTDLTSDLSTEDKQ